MRVLPIFFMGLSCGNLNLPNKYNTIKTPITTHMPIKISLFNKPHCFTKSALDRNLTAIASSRKPNTTFTEFNQPPDLGRVCSQPGNIANNAKGNANANPKPAKPAVSGHAPSAAVPANSEPRMGPVQENDTIAS